MIDGNIYRIDEIPGDTKDLKNDIKKLLSENLYTLAQTRCLFNLILDDFERGMPVTEDNYRDKKRIKPCGKYLEFEFFPNSIPIGGNKRWIRLRFYNECGKEYCPSNTKTLVTVYDENKSEINLDYKNYITIYEEPCYVGIISNNPDAIGYSVEIEVIDLDNKNVHNSISIEIKAPL